MAGVRTTKSTAWLCLLLRKLFDGPCVRAQAATAAAAAAAASSTPLPIPRARQAFVPRGSGDGSGPAGAAGILAGMAGGGGPPAGAGLGALPSPAASINPAAHYASARSWGGARFFQELSRRL